MIYLQLFISFIQVGMFSVGGGYAAVPLIREQVVEAHHWLTVNEFSHLVTIAGMTPGPVSINSATFVGIRIAGIGGAIVATAGCILPSCVIMGCLAYVYYRYRQASVLNDVLACLRPAVVALIASAGIVMLKDTVCPEMTEKISGLDWTGICLFGAAFFALRKWKKSPIAIMCLCGGAGLLLGCLSQAL